MKACLFILPRTVPSKSQHMIRSEDGSGLKKGDVGNSGLICLNTNMLGRNSSREFFRARIAGACSTYMGSLLFDCMGPKSPGGRCVALIAKWPCLSDFRLAELFAKNESLWYRH